MAEPIVIITDTPDQRAHALISAGLDRFNEEHTGIHDVRPLDVIVLDPETKEPLGGVTGHTSLGFLFLDLFFLPEHLRGSGLGSRVLLLAEEEGRRRGCVAGVLYTISFQAPAFYARHGWRAFGEVPCHPPGTSRVFMTKTFS